MNPNNLVWPHLNPFWPLLRNLWNMWQKSQYYTSQSAAVILHIYLLVKLELASNRCSSKNPILKWKLNFLWDCSNQWNRYFPSRLIFCHLLSRITFIEFLSQSYRNMYYFSLLLKFENRGIWTLNMNMIAWQGHSWIAYSWTYYIIVHI